MARLPRLLSLALLFSSRRRMRAETALERQRGASTFAVGEHPALHDPRRDRCYCVVGQGDLAYIVERDRSRHRSRSDSRGHKSQHISARPTIVEEALHRIGGQQSRRSAAFGMAEIATEQPLELQRRRDRCRSDRPTLCLADKDRDGSWHRFDRTRATRRFTDVDARRQGCGHFKRPRCR
jgi:hypothetical protein